MWFSEDVFYTSNFMKSKFSIRVIPCEINKLGISNEICSVYIVFHCQDTYKPKGSCDHFASLLDLPSSLPPRFPYSTQLVRRNNISVELVGLRINKFSCDLVS